MSDTNPLIQNKLLAALPADIYGRLQQCADTVQLARALEI
jgi:hypothetical protein